jgi:hypothetical protein
VACVNPKPWYQCRCNFGVLAGEPHGRQLCFGLGVLDGPEVHFSSDLLFACAKHYLQMFSWPTNNLCASPEHLVATSMISQRSKWHSAYHHQRCFV